MDRTSASTSIPETSAEKTPTLAEITELAPYAVTVQIKTEIRRKGAGANEEADLGRVIAILREARYAGYVVLEYEAAEDPLLAIPRHIKKLRELIS